MNESAKAYRIWYQGFTCPIENRAYVERLQQHFNTVADPEFNIEFHGISPPASSLHALTEMRCAVQCIKNAHRAQQEGYDAFLLGHFQEAGIDEVKALIDIPVIGLGESTMLHACTLGRKIGLITIDPTFIPWHEDQVVRYGLKERVIGVRAMRTSVEAYMRAFDDEDAYLDVRNQFVEQAQPLLEQGVEVLVPAGGLPMLLLSREQAFHVRGAPVLNGLTIAAKMAETAIKLNRLTGIGVSRVSTFAGPPQEAVEEFLASQ